MRTLLEDIFDSWRINLNFLLNDYLNSYYTFFTLILAECAYLFTFHDTHTAILLSIILISYIVIVLCTAFFKMLYEENYISLIYLGGFIAVCLVGCFINWKLCLLLTIIPLIATFICIVLRNFQINWTIHPPKLSTAIVISCMFITVGIPFILFTVFFSLIPAVPIALKIIVPLIYIIILPVAAHIEDKWATQDIFELFYELYE